jgi:outer membrane protein OmpA-like peptidoglycan-associated protein
LTLAGIGTYMDTQENELRASLRGTGGLVMRPGDDLIIVLRDDLLFNGAQISPMAVTVLDGLASVLRRFDRTSIQVQGFTDTRGAADRNLALSDTRAKAVQAALVAAGVPRNRVSAQGFGETRLRIQTGDNVTEPRNQRIEIRIIARPG